MSSFANRRGPSLLLVGVLLLAGCSTGGEAPDDQAGGQGGQAAGEPSASGEASPSPTPEETTSPSERPSERPTETPRESPSGSAEPKTAHPVVSRLGNAQWKQMVSTGTWRPECPVRRSDLRRVDLNHYTFSGDVRRGALVVNRDVADSISRVFSTLYEKRFPIRKMHPVEAFEGVEQIMTELSVHTVDRAHPAGIASLVAIASTIRCWRVSERAISVEPNVQNAWNTSGMSTASMRSSVAVARSVATSTAYDSSRVRRP